MSIPSVILMALAWLLLVGGITWYINWGTRKGEINFLKGIAFLLSLVAGAGILLTIAFIVS